MQRLATVLNDAIAGPEDPLMRFIAETPQAPQVVLAKL
jgi:hypothetical protein